MIITAKRKLTSGVAILCALMILIGIVPMDLLGGDNEAEAADSSITTVYFDTYVSDDFYTSDNSYSGWNGWTRNGDVYIYCYNSSNENSGIQKMTKDDSKTSRGNGMIYKYEVNSKYDKIIFLSGSTWNDSDKATQTPSITLSDYSAYTELCFRVTSEVDSSYNRKVSCYELKTGTTKADDIVEIKSGTKPTSSDDSLIYVNTTFYDYYSDWEKEGKSLSTHISGSADGAGGYAAGDDNWASQANWVTFKKFNTTLSDYYKSVSEENPMYTGHFQPNLTQTDKNNVKSYWGFPFSDSSIGKSLYGVGDFEKFYSTNNSVGNMSTTSESTVNSDGYYDSANQKLVYSSDENGLYLKDEKAIVPQFSSSYADETYENVEFPFEKDTTSEAYDYYKFNSSETTLYMQKDSSSGYFLAKTTDTTEKAKSKNLNSASKTSGVSAEYGFFPFNENSTSCDANTYNYGFGMVMSFEFTLTNNGKVLNRDGTTYSDQIFKFIGDDDVWVFIDNQLVLDVGGSHGQVTGTINFAEQTATVSKVKSGANNESVTSGSEAVSIFAFSDKKSSGSISNGGVDTSVGTTKAGTHTLTMYYMERGMWESNMSIEFNLTPENQLDVDKTVDISSVNNTIQTAIKDNVNNIDFNYTIKKYTETSTTVCDSGSSVTSATKDGKTAYKCNLVHNSDETYGIKFQLNSNGNAVDLSDMDYICFDYYFGDSLSGSHWFKVGIYDENSEIIGEEVWLTNNDSGIDNTILSGWNTNKIPKSKFGNNLTGKVKYVKIIYYEDLSNLYITNLGYISGASSSDVIVTNNASTTTTASLTSLTKNYTLGTGLTDSGTTAETNTANNGEFQLRNQDTKEKPDNDNDVAKRNPAHFKNQYNTGDYLQVSEGDTFTYGSTSYNLGDLFTTSWVLTQNSGTTDEDSNTDGYQTKENNSTTVGNEEKTVDGKAVSVFKFDSDSTDTPNVVSFTNKMNVGSLKITKQFYEYDGKTALNTTDKVTIKVKLTNIGGISGLVDSSGNNDYVELTDTIELTNASSGDVTFKGIPVGTSYEIEEVTVNGYTTKYNKQTGTISKDENSETVTNTKKVTPYSLTLKKTLYDTNGTTEITSDTTAFAFTVTLSTSDTSAIAYMDEKFSPVTTGSAGTENWLKTTSNGTTTYVKIYNVSAKDSQTISDIPSGVSYTVTEKLTTDQESSFEQLSAQNTSTSGTISADTTATIVNKKKEAIVMPSTGGSGETPSNVPYVLFGLGAIALVGGALLLNKKYAFLRIKSKSKEVR